MTLEQHLRSVCRLYRHRQGILLSRASAVQWKLAVPIRGRAVMLWKVGLYLVLAWAAVCTVLTLTFFGRLAFVTLRARFRNRRTTPAAASPG
jgi:hypothetical protein